MRNLISAYRKRRVHIDEVRRASIIDEQRQAEKKRQKEQEEANHREIIASLNKIADSHNTYANDRRSEDGYRRTWEGKRFRLDIAGVVVAASAAAFLLWQQHTMQGQLDQMKAASTQTARASRPYLLFEPVTMTFTPTAEQLAGFSIPGQVMPLMPGRHFVAIFKFTNYGATPALIFTVTHYIEFPQINSWSFRSLIPAPLAKGYVVGSQKSTTNFWEPQTFSEITWQKLIGGGGKLYLSSKVIYEDVFGNRYETMVCFKIDVPFGSLTPREVGPNCSNKRT